MLRTRLSRASLAALAIAALASGGILAASDTAQAGRIDPGFNRGPPRLDPGIGGGPTRVDPGFSKADSGPKFTASRVRGDPQNAGCHMMHNPNWTFRNGAPRNIKVCY